MTLTIEVSNELESRIEEEAKRNGMSKSDFVRIMLEEKLSLKAKKPKFPAKITATDLPVKDRSREYDWLAKNRDKYDGKYVALNGDHLIAVGDNYKDAATKARELGAGDALIVYVEGHNHPRFISGGLWRE
jgi:negative regulator of replication initiation